MTNRFVHPFKVLPAVHVAVPTYGATPGVCMLSFGIFMANGAAKGYIQHAGQFDGAYIDRARNDLIRQAINNGSTHIFFLDQDMIIPDNTLQRLLSHGVDYAAGSYWGKDDYFTPVSFHLDPFHRIYELEDCMMAETDAGGIDGMECWCGKTDDHLHVVGGTGMGCTLLTTDLLQRISKYYETHACPCGSKNCEPERWFSTLENGEDVHLCMRMEEMGIDRYLDGFVQCGHVRTQIVSKQHYDWAKQNAPRCTYHLPGVDVEDQPCGKVAFWHTGDDDAAEKSTRCFEHRNE